MARWAWFAFAAAAAGVALEPAPVPTLDEAIAQAPEIVRVKVLAVPAEGPAEVDVREVYFGDFENQGWLDASYKVPGAPGEEPRLERVELKVGAQYVLFTIRGPGGVYQPYLFWNTRWGIAEVVGGADGELDLSRLAEGSQRLTLAEFREKVRAIKWGM